MQQQLVMLANHARCRPHLAESRYQAMAAALLAPN